MSVLRALWLVRPDLHRDPGGDTTQIDRTRERLAEEGVSVTLSSERNPALAGFDLVHLFHLDRLWENVHWCRLIRRRGLPAVLSPIYYPTEELDRRGRSGSQRLLTRLVGAGAYPSLRVAQRAAFASAARGDPRWLRRELLSFDRGARYVLESLSALLPNSETERRVLERRLGLRAPVVVVPNGVDTEFFAPPDEETERGDVLCVGRVAPRKNQLALIRALRGSGRRVRFVGGHGFLGGGYARRCRREATPGFEFLGVQDGHSLRRLYRSARVHVNVSWFETPGLASLEAAACGCAVVVTRGGSTREYFGDDAYYCDPGDAASIRSAVERALERPAPPELSARIRAQYPWSVAAQRTRKAYDLALARPEPGARRPAAATRRSRTAPRGTPYRRTEHSR